MLSRERQAKLKEIGVELREDRNSPEKANDDQCSGARDSSAGASDGSAVSGSPEASAAAAAIDSRHPSRTERPKKASNTARRNASIIGGFEVRARPKVQPIDDSSMDASAATVPDGQGKVGVYEEDVGDSVSLVRAHACSAAAAAEQADEQSGQVGKSMKSTRL